MASVCVCVYACARRHLFKRCSAMCIYKPLTLFLSSRAYFNIYFSVSVYTHLPPQPRANNHVFRRVCVCVWKPLTPSGRSLCVCVRAARWAEVTVSLEQQKNDLQGLLSLISIWREEIDKDHHFADGSEFSEKSCRNTSRQHQSRKSPDASSYTFISNLAAIGIFHSCNTLWLWNRSQLLVAHML